MSRWSERLERIRQWRETVISLAVIAVLLGVLVNLLAASLYEKSWLVALIFSIVVLGVLAGTIIFLHRQFTTDSEVFECIVPLAIDLERKVIEVLELRPYPCSRMLHQAVTVAFRREVELRSSLLESYVHRGSAHPFHRPQPLWRFVHSLLFYALASELREFANESLGHGGRHGPWASLAVGLDKERRRVRDVNQTLWSTMVRFMEPGDETLSIHLPPGSTLTISMDEEAGIPSQLALNTRYLAICLAISRFWSSASLASKAGRVVRRLGGDLAGQHELLRRIEKGAADFWIGRVPIEVTIRFRPLWMFSRRGEFIYAWGAECVDYLRERLAWSTVLDNETERLVVELYEKLESLNERASLR